MTNFANLPKLESNHYLMKSLLRSVKPRKRDNRKLLRESKKELSGN